jgi:hypothetical protein
MAAAAMDCSRGGPVSEDHIGGDGPQMLEEAIPRTAYGDGGSPGEGGEISRGVEGEGEQVKGDQDVGEDFLAMSEIVFEVVSISLDYVESLVLDLPTGATAGGQVGDGVGRDREIRNEAVLAKRFVSVSQADRNTGPVVDQSAGVGEQLATRNILCREATPAPLVLQFIKHVFRVGSIAIQLTQRQDLVIQPSDQGGIFPNRLVRPDLGKSAVRWRQPSWQSARNVSRSCAGFARSVIAGSRASPRRNRMIRRWRP